MINQAFAHSGKEDEIYLLTIGEIVDAQKKDRGLKPFFKKKMVITKKRYGFHLIENTRVLCKGGKIVIPTTLQYRAVSWYHHYLQHPGHSWLEETLRSAMYWTGMRNSI